MKKVNFAINPNNKKMDEAKSRALDELLKDDEINELIESLNLTEGEINSILGWLLTYQEAKVCCKGCREKNLGADKCIQEIKCVIPTPVRNEDGSLEQKYIPCPLFVRDSHYIVKDFDKLYDNASLDNIKTSGNLGKLVKTLFKYADTSEGKGFTLSGQKSAGKTYALACLTNEYADNGLNCAFVDTKRFVKDMKDYIFAHDKEYYNEQFDKLLNVDVLVLDNLGSETVSPWSRDELLLPLLEERGKKNRLTFVTTKYNRTQLQTLYSIGSKNMDLNAARLAASEFLETLEDVCPWYGEI